MKKVIITVMLVYFFIIPFISPFISPLIKKLLQGLYPAAQQNNNTTATNKDNVQAIIIECHGDYPFYGTLGFDGAPKFLDKDTPDIMWEYIECNTEDEVVTAIESLTPQQQADSWVLSGDMTDGLCKANFAVFYPITHPNAQHLADIKPANPTHSLYKPDEWSILQQVRDLLK